MFPPVQTSSLSPLDKCPSALLSSQVCLSHQPRVFGLRRSFRNQFTKAGFVPRCRNTGARIQSGLQSGVGEWRGCLLHADGAYFGRRNVYK